MFGRRSGASLGLLVAFLLAACQPTPAASPISRPDLVTVQLTPALHGLLPQMNACVRETAGIGITINETPTASLDMKSAGIILRWGAPQKVPTSAFVLGSQKLMVVANKANPLVKLSLAQLQSIYSGEAATWQDVSKDVGTLAKKEIHPYAYPGSEDIQQYFAGLLVPQAVKSGASFLAPNPEALRQAVSADPLAVGFLPERDVDTSIKILALESIPAEKLTQPILALSNAEPQGPARQWLACLENKLK